MFHRGPGPEFPDTSHRRETVSVELMAVREKSIAVWDGITMEDYVNPKTGVVINQKKWTFLPKSSVEIAHKGKDIELSDWKDYVGKTVDVTTTEKLLTEKELL